MDADVVTVVGKPERVTQKRLIALFRDELRYRYLGNRSDYPDNSNIEEKLLSAYLIQAGYRRHMLASQGCLSSGKPAGR